jgi:hypothetical protein
MSNSARCGLAWLEAYPNEAASQLQSYIVSLAQPRNLELDIPIKCKQCPPRSFVVSVLFDAQVRLSLSVEAIRLSKAQS